MNTLATQFSLHHQLEAFRMTVVEDESFEADDSLPDLSAVPELIELDRNGNKIKELDVRPTPKLETLKVNPDGEDRSFQPPGQAPMRPPGHD